MDLESYIGIKKKINENSFLWKVLVIIVEELVILFFKGYMKLWRVKFLL